MCGSACDVCVWTRIHIEEGRRDSRASRRFAQSLYEQAARTGLFPPDKSRLSLTGLLSEQPTPHAISPPYSFRHGHDENRQFLIVTSLLQSVAAPRVFSSVFSCREPQTMKMITCTGCSRPILDRFLLNVSDEYWHSECVMCSECKVKLTEKCFSREGKLFCRNDFFKKFGTKCSGCMQGIQPTDFVRRAKSQVFHLKCFTCFICRKQLSTGEELYVTEDNRFICKEDFLNSRQSHARGESFLDLFPLFLLTSHSLKSYQRRIIISQLT